MIMDMTIDYGYRLWLSIMTTYIDLIKCKRGKFDRL